MDNSSVAYLKEELKKEGLNDGEVTKSIENLKDIYIGQNIREKDLGILQSHFHKFGKLTALLLKHNCIEEVKWHSHDIYHTTEKGLKIGKILVTNLIDEKKEIIEEILNEKPQKVLNFIMQEYYLKKKYDYFTYPVHTRNLSYLPDCKRLLIDNSRIHTAWTSVLFGLEVLGLCVRTYYYVSTRGGEIRDEKYVLSPEVFEFLVEHCPKEGLTEEEYENGKLYDVLLHCYSYHDSPVDDFRNAYWDKLRDVGLEEKKVQEAIDIMEKIGITSKYHGLLGSEAPFSIKDESRYRIWFEKTLIQPVIESLLELPKRDKEKHAKLKVSPNSYDFGDVKKGNTPSKIFTVENAGEITLNWEVHDYPDWLDVSTTSGTNDGSFTVTVRSDASVGDYDGTVEVISNGGSVSIDVSVHIGVITPPPPSDLKILLGRDENNKEIFWEPKKEINWSFVIVGSAGTGKTQTVKAILSEFAKFKLPYIIFDFRNDYISKTKESEFGQILDLSTISINPLELDGDNTPKDQKYQISDIVDLVYNIGERQVGYIRSAIKRSYEDKGINEEDEDSWNNVPPTFDDIQNNLNRLFEEGDSGTRSSIEGIFARLDPIFDYGIFSAKTVMPFEKIMKGQTVVNLGILPNEKLKAVVCEFFMRKLRYYLDKIGESREPRLYVIIDEAHRLKYEREASAGQLLKEARKYGVGMLLSTQDPVDFTDVVYNNIGGIMSLQLTDPKYAKSIAEHLGGKVTWQNVKNDLSSKFSAYVKFSQNPAAIRFGVIPHYER